MLLRMYPSLVKLYGPRPKGAEVRWHLVRPSKQENLRPNAENLPEDFSPIITSCWMEDPNARPNFSQIIQMLLKYLSTIPQPECVTPPTMHPPENAVLPPESPGTSSLMAATRHGTGEVSHGATEQNSSSFFSCFAGNCY